MTPFEDGLIKALERMGNTDWIGNIFNVIMTIITSAFSAWTAFRVAKYQIEKQITKQNSLEIKREKRMLATQIRLDKYEDLIDSLTEYSRLVNRYYLNVLYYTHSSKYSEKTTFEQLRIIEEDLQQEILLKSKKIEILSAYHPEIRNKWDALDELYEDFSNLIMDIITYPNRFKLVEEDISFEDVTEKYELFNIQYSAIEDMLTNAIIKIINDLESDL